MEILTGFFASKVFQYAAGSIAAVILAWILKKIPNEKIKLAVGKLCFSAGVALTLGMSKWKYTAKIWNKTVEPWLIDLIDNVVGHGVSEFIRGLRSD